MKILVFCVLFAALAFEAGARYGFTHAPTPIVVTPQQPIVWIDTDATAFSELGVNIRLHLASHASALDCAGHRTHLAAAGVDPLAVFDCRWVTADEQLQNWRGRQLDRGIIPTR